MKKRLSFVLVLLLALSLCLSALADNTCNAEDVISLLKTTFANTDGIAYDFSYDEDSNLFYITATMDGIAQDAVRATTNDTALDSWHTLRDSITSLNTSTLDFIKAMTGSDNVSLAISILNDQNTDNVLLTIFNSIVVYDVVDGIDLMP